MGFLSEAVERLRKELDLHPLPERTLLLRTRSAPPIRDLAGALRSPGVSIIAEVKRATPWGGRVGEVDPGEQAALYESGGAAAVSVVTEPRYFQGSVLDLRSARRKCGLPLVRRDFILQPAQVMEARAEGADAVWLAAAVLTRSELGDLQDVAADLGMASLVEVHSDEDLKKAVGGEAQVIVLSARDPETLEVHPETPAELAGRVPDDRILVLEGGITSRSQILRAEEGGFHGVLVGEALMRSPNPVRTLRRLAGGLAVVNDPGT
jgi:indole-3-glycerol phosphate synthase